MKTKDLYKQEILRLENKRDAELKLVKEELYTGYEYIKPVNILKRTLSEAAKSPEIKGDIFKIGLNMATSFLTNKISGDSKNPLKKWLFSFLQSTVTKYVGNHGGNIKLTLEKLGLQLLNKISRKTTSQSDSEAGSKDHLSKTAA